jgi:hypothetical protein
MVSELGGGTVEDVRFSVETADPEMLKLRLLDELGWNG